ncbi:MAG: thiol reductase thioredoxin [Tannerella sp.]|nr:thiol reductase thioredoxin [Tannerella sp.]
MKKIAKTGLLMAAFLVAMNAFSQSDGQAAADRGEVIVLSKADFLASVWNYEKNSDKWVYEGKLPCVIDFYADWCGPCRRVAPIMKELAKEYKGKVLFYKIDVDNERELASVFQVSSIPSYLFIPATGDPQTGVGAYSRDFFVKAINDFLLKKEL